MNNTSTRTFFRLLFAPQVVNMEPAGTCSSARFAVNLPLNRSPLRAAPPVSVRKSYGSVVPQSFQFGNAHLPLHSGKRGSRESSTCYCGALPAGSLKDWPTTPGSQLRQRIAATSRASSAKVLAPVGQAVNSGETATPARVLQATAQYSICGWGEFICAIPSTTTSWSYAHQHLKAAESNLNGLKAKMSREVVYRGVDARLGLQP